MRPRIAVALLAIGCGGSAPPPATSVYEAYDYTPEFGARFTYVEPGVTTGGTQLHMLVGNGSWDLRTGDDFDSGTDFASWPTSVDNEIGLVVDGTILLPAGFEEGDDFDTGTIEFIGKTEVVIGTYAEAITARIDEGPLAGEAIFVVGTGPVALTIDGTRWEASVVEKP